MYNSNMPNRPIASLFNPFPNVTTYSNFCGAPYVNVNGYGAHRADSMRPNIGMAPINPMLSSGPLYR